MNSDQISRQFPGVQLENPVLSHINIHPIPLDLNSWIQILGWMWSASSPWRDSLIGKKMWLCLITMCTGFQSARENWGECYQQSGEEVFAYCQQLCLTNTPFLSKDMAAWRKESPLLRTMTKEFHSLGSMLFLYSPPHPFWMCFCVCPLATVCITTPKPSGNPPGMPLLQVNSSCQSVFVECVLSSG